MGGKTLSTSSFREKALKLHCHLPELEGAAKREERRGAALWQT